MKKSQQLIFTGIKKLYTLAGASRKGGRRTTYEDLSVIDRAAMVVQNGRLIWIGPERSNPYARQKIKRIDLGGMQVIPALVESHTHLLFGGSRAAEFERRNAGESYQSIAKSGGGILSTVQATRTLSEAKLVQLAQKRVDEFVRQGVATIEIKSGYGLSLQAERKMLRAAGRVQGPRVVRTFLGAHAVAPEFASAKDYLAHLTSEVLPQIQKQKLASRVDIFLEKGYFEKDLARSYLSQAQKLGFAVVIHADQLSRSGGAELAVELAGAGGRVSAEHLLCLNENDIARLARSEVTCGLLPTSDLYMNCPYPPARQLINSGARVALATDFNPGTSPSSDIATVGVLARVQMKMSLPETLVAYTVGAAHALGLEAEIGSLETGKSADFAVLEGDLEELFYSIGSTPVISLFRSGQCLIN